MRAFYPTIPTVSPSQKPDQWADLHNLNKIWLVGLSLGSSRQPGVPSRVQLGFSRSQKFQPVSSLLADKKTWFLSPITSIPLSFFPFHFLSLLHILILESVLYQRDFCSQCLPSSVSSSQFHSSFFLFNFPPMPPPLPILHPQFLFLFPESLSAPLWPHIQGHEKASLGKVCLKGK